MTPAVTPAPASPARIAAAASGRQWLRRSCRPARRGGRPVPGGEASGVATGGGGAAGRAAVTVSGVLLTWMNVRVTGSGSQPVAG